MYPIFHIIIQVILFFVGLFFQTKTISVCIEEKGKTWHIHVTHAIVMTIYYGFFIPFQASTYFLPFLAQYVGGTWICYIASIVSFYCYHSILAHSLLVAVMKYSFINHAMKVKAFGEEKLQNIFFWINLILPLLLTIAAMMTTDFQTRSALKNCFGHEDGKDLQSLNHDSASGGSKNFLFCDLTNTPEKIYGLAQFVCVSRSLLNIAICTNLPEGFFYYMIFRSMKRQVDPTVENNPANSLPSDVQARNIRLVKVNTRVTLVIWIFESVANICIALVWVYIYGTTSFGTLTNSMIWYYLLISYTFLMNTSYNKDRIVDDGWKPVLLNSIVNPFRNNKPEDQDKSTNDEIKNIRKKYFLNHKKGAKDDVYSFSKSRKGLQKNPLSMAKTEHNQKIKIFTISKEESILNVEDIEQNTNIPMSCWTSNPRQEEKLNNANRNFPNDYSNTVLDEKNESTDPLTSDRLRIGEELLSRMLSEVNNEPSYLHFFKQLMAFENFINDKYSKLNGEFQIKSFHETVNSTRKIYVENSFNQCEVDSSSLKRRIKHSKNRLCQQKLKNTPSTNVNYVIDVLIRAQLRRDMLKHYKVHCNDERRYNDFLNSLSEFEEMLLVKS